MFKSRKEGIIVFGFLILALCMNGGCRGRIDIPKPHAYPRIVFPQGPYRMISESYCALQFEFPTYGQIVQTTSFFEDKPADPCWFTIQIPTLNASVHCSYGQISPAHTYDRYIQDAFQLLSKHNIKAEYREETRLTNPFGVKGMAFELDGPVATPYQFYLTDSVRHFFRAALYFNAAVNPDSTKPALDFIKKDLLHMQQTFEWKKK